MDNIPQCIKIINSQFSDKWEFMDILYEKHIFDYNLFRKLIDNIKKTHWSYDIYKYINNKYEKCVWFSFISNLFDRLSLLLYIESDIRFYDDVNLNITNEEFHDYIEELNFELQSLFAWWEKDYHWNNY